MSIIIDGSNSGTALSDTATQTLSNKTLASPVITGTQDLQGGQIKFPATQVPSSDANTLDDYEEGTFNPGLWDATSGGNEATYSVRHGTYTKIGNLCFFQIAMDISSSAGMTGANEAVIRSLPFTNRSNSGNYPFGLSVTGNGITFSGFLTGYIPSGASYLYVAQQTSGASVAPITVSNLGTGWVTVSGCYIVA